MQAGRRQGCYGQPTDLTSTYMIIISTSSSIRTDDNMMMESRSSFTKNDYSRIMPPPAPAVRQSTKSEATSYTPSPYERSSSQPYLLYGMVWHLRSNFSIPEPQKPVSQYQHTTSPASHSQVAATQAEPSYRKRPHQQPQSGNNASKPSRNPQNYSNFEGEKNQISTARHTRIIPSSLTVHGLYQATTFSGT
jgi:hypothetical protein